jgi:hypothetical protein
MFGVFVLVSVEVGISVTPAGVRLSNGRIMIWDAPKLE